MGPTCRHRRVGPAPDRTPPAGLPSRPGRQAQRRGCACGGGCPACVGASGAGPPAIGQGTIAAPVVQRKPADAPPPTSVEARAPQDFPPRVQTAATVADVAKVGSDVSEGRVEASAPIYPGDVVFVRVSRLETEFPPGGLVLTLPPGDLELVKQTEGNSAWLRAIATPDSVGSGRRIDVVLASPALAEPVTVAFRLLPAPAAPDVARPDIEAEMVALKREIRSTRAEIRDVPAEEAERLWSLEAILVSLQHHRETLELASEAWADLSCATQSRQVMIQEALEIAANRVAAATARLLNGLETDPTITAALAEYLRIDPAPEAADARRDAAARAVDVFSTARNGMLAAAPDQFHCAETKHEDCSNPLKAASVAGPGPRGGRITICPRFFDGHLPEKAGEAGQPGLRAFALFHEYVHLAGVSSREAELPIEKKEMYLHHTEDWPKLTPEQAATLADAYAALGFVLSAGEGG